MSRRALVSAIKKDDRLLSLLAIALVLDTMLGAAAAEYNIDSSHEFQGYQAWNRLLWLVLVAAVLLRALRRAGQLALSVSERDMHLRDVARTSHEWLWETDENLVVISSSPAVTLMLGRRPSEVIGQNLFGFVADQDRGRTRDIVTGARAQGSGWHEITLSWTHAGGKSVQLQGSGIPILGKGSRPTGFRGTWGPLSEISAAERNAAIVGRTRAVLCKRSVRIAFQPIVELHTRSWIGMEALARFPDGRSPLNWLAEAHEAGLGLELERLCLEATLESTAQVPDGVYMAVNASPQLIVTEEFAAALDAHASRLQHLVLEITENTAVSRYDDIHRALAPFRSRGLRLAVDDTGAGFASFSHVLSLRPDMIKLDRSLISGIQHDPARRAFVKAVVWLAAELGATVTAEGIEHHQEFTVLADLAVDTAQGYLFAKPSTDVRKWSDWADGNWEGLLHDAVLLHGGVA